MNCMSKIIFWEEIVKCTKIFEDILFFLAHWNVLSFVSSDRSSLCYTDAQYLCPISLIHLLKTHVLVHRVNLHKDDADS